MTDKPKYDPDRMTFEDLDPHDLDAMREWLDHPVTKALHEDLARSVRNLPVEEQRLLADRFLAKVESSRQQFLEALDAETNPEVIEAFEQGVRELNEHAILALRRIRELRAQ